MQKTHIVIILSTLLLAGCGAAQNDPNPPSIDTTFDRTVDPNKNEAGDYVLDFYGLNDFHGAITTSTDGKEPGFAKLATFFREKYKENPGGTILVSSGDMWQGTADSNITKGKMMTMMMNALYFEAMAIGNHEFDWTTSLIEENAQIANFPMLGANIYEKATEKRATFAEPSILIERGNVKVGIVGTIGVGLESSIQKSYVKDYEFLNPADIVSEEADKLRASGADAVVLLDHADWRTPSYFQGKITASEKINAVFSGHSHTSYTLVQDDVPVLQTNGSGQQVMHVQLTVSEAGIVNVASYELVDSLEYITPLQDDPVILDIYDYYYNQQIKAVKDVVVGKLSLDMPKDLILNATTQAILEGVRKTNPDVEIAIYNLSGGIRVNELPKGKVTFGDVYKALPFDNEIGIFTLTGKEIKDLGSNLRKNGVKGLTIDNGTTYKVAIISYVFEGAGYDRSEADEILIKYPRDYLADLFKAKKTINPANYDRDKLNIL